MLPSHVALAAATSMHAPNQILALVFQFRKLVMTVVVVMVMVVVMAGSRGPGIRGE